MRGKQGGSEGGRDDYGMSPHYHTWPSNAITGARGSYLFKWVARDGVEDIMEGVVVVPHPTQQKCESVSEVVEGHCNSIITPFVPPNTQKQCIHVNIMALPQQNCYFID